MSIQLKEVHKGDVIVDKEMRVIGIVTVVVEFRDCVWTKNKYGEFKCILCQEFDAYAVKSEE